MSAADNLHAAICQAVGVLNIAPDVARISEGRQVSQILRGALSEYAEDFMDEPAPESERAAIHKGHMAPQALPVPEPQLAASGGVPPLSTVCPKDSLPTCGRCGGRGYFDEGSECGRCKGSGLDPVGAGAAELPEPAAPRDMMHFFDHEFEDGSELDVALRRYCDKGGRDAVRSLDGVIKGLMRRYADLAAPIGAGAAELPEPAAWQERQEKTGGGWTAWYEASPKGMGEGRALSQVIGGVEYQWRPLYAAPLGAVAVDASPQNPDSVHQVGVQPQAAAALGRFMGEEP